MGDLQLDVNRRHFQTSDAEYLKGLVEFTLINQQGQARHIFQNYRFFRTHKAGTARVGLRCQWVADPSAETVKTGKHLRGCIGSTQTGWPGWVGQGYQALRVLEQ
jgi:hypothetical protein